MADVFDAVQDLARKTNDFELKTSAIALLGAYKRLKHEVDAVRKARAKQRIQDTRRGDINMMPKFGELHMLEVHGCKLLCPALRHGSGTASKEGWDWVKKQPWAADFMAAPIDKRRF